MEALETYLRHMYRIRSSGEAVAETSYYGALEQLLNHVGSDLSPRMHCIVNIKNRGGGFQILASSWIVLSLPRGNLSPGLSVSLKEGR